MEDVKQAVNEPATTSVEKSGGGKSGIWILIVIVVLGVGAYLIWGSDSEEEAAVVMNDSSVAALVNGKEISRALLDTRIAQTIANAEAQGVAIAGDQLAQIEQQAIDQLVSENLVFQVATKSGVTADDASVTEQYDQIAARFASSEEFLAELAANDFTEEEFRADVHRQLVVQNYLDEQVAAAVVIVTDEEVAAAYATLTPTETEEVPALEDIEAEIRAQLEQQAALASVQDHIQDLRNAANVEIMEVEEDMMDDDSESDKDDN
ncbi:hypothetical protein COB55_01365 [Candidatus Wolfebacteria bacterium]|nr:MAG: hypothetical protein COB55_01365 [Candidatus Wolfebacteria bacterium]